MTGDSEPLVSIVTPSYNSGRFLEETIQSVLRQDYPRIEYLVMDGGSTDGSQQILERHKDRLTYYSTADRGQADAVNRGFQHARGSIFAFLNADDTYLPGAVSAAVRHLVERPGLGAVYGEAYHISESGQTIGRYPTLPFSTEQLRHQCFICQPAAFMRSHAFRAAGMLDPQLHYALDYDLWIRLAQKYPMQKIDQYLARSRMHAENKTLGQLRQVFREVFIVLRRHYDYVPVNWLYGYADYLITGKNPVFGAPPPTPRNLALCVLLGASSNWRHPFRYGKDLVQTAGRIRTCSQSPS